MDQVASGGRPILALLVDDDSAYLEVLKFFLEREGMIEGATTTSARQALDLLSQRKFDAIVSDYLMPDMDGLELLKIVRLQGMDTPFIMLTGRGREDVAIQALNTGADFYIQKGGDPKAQYTDLTNMIRKSVMQRRAERGVKEGEQFLKKLFESIQDGVSVLGKDMVIESVNPAIERWYADSMPLVGKKCYEAYHSRSEPCEVCPTINTLRSGRTDRQRLVKGGVNGEGTGWLDVYTFPVVDKDTGEVQQVIEYLRDVTEEEAAKRALESSERRYKALVEVASEGIIAIESGGTITFANPRMARMLGYAVEDLVGMHIRSLVDRGWLQTHGLAHLHRVLEEGERIEMVLAKKDGSTAQVIVAASPVSSERGLFDGAVAVVTDVGELKSLMQSVKSSEERFAKAFRAAPPMIIIARASDCAILEANDSFVKATGYGIDQLVGRSYIDLGIVSKDLASRLEQLLAERGSVSDLEATLGTSSGGERAVRLSGYRLDLQGQQCTVLISSGSPSEGSLGHSTTKD